MDLAAEGECEDDEEDGYAGEPLPPAVGFAVGGDDVLGEVEGGEGVVVHCDEAFAGGGEGRERWGKGDEQAVLRRVEDEVVERDV